ncbi:MAG: pirin family protein [Nitrospira sp.]|nr:pirin family protein [Nitrospira sp.]
MKPMLQVYKPTSAHWVGDGFPVRNIFSDENLGEAISPFLLLDYAGPAEFPPSNRQRGVGEHPHRGFETVTIVYQGELVHRDSAGNHGTIGPGDVQWMTAASGVVHEEKHEPGFAKRGGMLEMVQLWVNLPKAVKMAPPRYQTLLNEQIPVAYLAQGAGQVRVIAGEFHGLKGPAKTFTPIHVYDLHLTADDHTELSFPTGYNIGLFVRKGSVVVNQSYVVGEVELAFCGAAGERINIQAKEEATLLVLSGEPINEPVVWRGPFVTNTEEELVQAMADYQAGRMGHLD